MPKYCEVVVNRPIIRYPVISERDYPEERSLLAQPSPEPDENVRSPAAANPWDVTFSYAVPEELCRHVALGQLVEVPFRTGSLQGVIIGLSETPSPDIDIRPLISILDPTPALFPTQIELVRWLSARYLGPLSSCTWLCLPPGISQLPQTVVEAVKGKQPPTDLDARAYAMLLYLQNKEEPTPAHELEAEPLRILSDIELVQTRQRLAPPRIGPQIDRTVELIATPEEVAAVLPTLGRPSRQADVLEYLVMTDDPLPALHDLYEATGCTKSHINELYKKGRVDMVPQRQLVFLRQPPDNFEAATTLDCIDTSPRATALAYLRDHPAPVALDEFCSQVDSSRQQVRLLVKQSIAKITQSYRVASLNIPPHKAQLIMSEELKNAPKQIAILDYLQKRGQPVDIKELCAITNSSSNTLKALEQKGWVEITCQPAMISTALPPQQIEEIISRESQPIIERKSILDYLRKHAEPVDQAILLRETLASEYALNRLEKEGLMRRIHEPARAILRLDPHEVFEATLELKGTTKYAAVIEMLSREEGRVWVGWVYAQTDATLSTLRTLAEVGLIALDEARHWRDPLADQSFVLAQPPRLTPEQQTVWDVIRKGMRQSGTQGSGNQVSEGGLPDSLIPRSPVPNPFFLLHGVTGSGKTEIYLQAVEEALQHGRGAIFLVPEIALAAQTVRRVVARFPGKVAVWHSDLSLGERFDTWQRVRSGELPIVVGARSALFAPVANLGLIVVDEEHEPAYKEHRAPRYHAREAALQLGRLSGATVLLGSATPDVSTFRQAERGELTLLTLPKRVLAHRQHLSIQLKAAHPPHPLQVDRPLKGGLEGLRSLPLPSVEVVDLREELKAGNRTIFSRVLQHAIRETLEANQQVLLYLNRRGAATFVLCRDCGYVMRCPRCEMPLTFHEGEDALICHHCNRRQPDPDQCPACHSTRIRYFGLGTERVEAAVHEMFPNARPLRWDLDTARARGSHAAFLQQLIDGRANLLVGTQMIAKGLDLPRVTLVGIISADTALYLPDFRAAERTFQLLMQVAGRAGRSPLGGRVILQTYNPDLPVIRAAAAHDYAAFYRDELIARHDSRYPPFKRLARLVFTGTGAERAQREAERMAKALQSYVARQGTPGVDLVGPAPCFYRKLRGKYRWHIVIRAQEPEELLRLFTLPLGWRVDVDPVDFL